MSTRRTKYVFLTARIVRKLGSFVFICPVVAPLAGLGHVEHLVHDGKEGGREYHSQSHLRVLGSQPSFGFTLMCNVGPPHLHS